MNPIPEHSVVTSVPSSERENKFEQRRSLEKYRRSFSEIPRERPRLLSEVDESTPLLSRNQEATEFDLESQACRNAIKLLLSIISVFSMVSQVISTTLFTNALSRPGAGSDAFVASFLASMWIPLTFFLLNMGFAFREKAERIFCPPAPWQNVLMAGLLVGLHNILVASTSLTSRTPAYLQGILQQLLIPFTAIVRYFLLHKGTRPKQIMCIVVLLVGVFISVEPSMFGLRSRDVFIQSVQSQRHAWYFYVVYAVAWLPLAIGYAITEKSQKMSDSQIMSYTAWMQLAVFLSHFVFIWVDFIPGLGMALQGDTGFTEKLHNGFRCFYSENPNCSDVPRLGMAFIVSYSATTVFSVLLIRFAEGALFAVICMTLATPITAFFWTLFSAEPELRYKPQFDLTSVFVLVGLLIMTPATILYAYLGQDDDEVASAKEKVPQPSLKSRPPKRRWTVDLSDFNPSPNVMPKRKESLSPKSRTSRSLQRTRSSPLLVTGF